MVDIKYTIILIKLNLKKIHESTENMHMIINMMFDLFQECSQLETVVKWLIFAKGAKYKQNENMHEFIKDWIVP